MNQSVTANVCNNATGVTFELDLKTNGTAYFFGLYQGDTTIIAILKQLFHLYLQKVLSTDDFTLSLDGSITAAVKKFNQCLLDNNIVDNATAAIALYIKDTSNLHLISLGDSPRVVVWDGLSTTTSSKSVSAFGKKNVELSTLTIPLNNTEYTLLIANNVFWNVFDASKIKTLSKNPCKQLIALAKQKGLKEDSFSVLHAIIKPTKVITVKTITGVPNGTPKIIPEQNVLDHVITINAHGGWLADSFIVPKGIELMIPHYKGLGHTYKTEQCLISYEDLLYNKGYFNYTTGWTLYKSGTVVNNMFYTPLKKNCPQLVTKDYLFEMMIPCIQDEFKKGWCPIFVSAGEKPLFRNGEPQIKIKACGNYTLKELCLGLPAALKDLQTKGIIKKVPDPIIIIPFTCNASSDTFEVAKIAKSGTIPLNVSDSVEYVPWNESFAKIYTRLLAVV